MASRRVGKSSERTPIQGFYAGSHVFLTGATGFFGKIMIDKLFRTCPDIGSVVIMIRAKKGKTAEQRMEELFSEPVFDKLKSEVPDFRSKIFPIIGDCREPQLGLSEKDVNIITSKINVVFHVAATVKFDENIKIALNINVKGTTEVMKICKKCTSLKCLIYVSTAFAHCNHYDIEEKFYEPLGDSDMLLSFVEHQSDTRLENLTPRILGPYPNTYAFTKSLAEDVVRRNCENLPITVFRPAIVIGSYREPIAGWIDNMYGPTGVVAGVGAGLLRAMCADPERVADIVPVDLVVNAIIAAAWDTAETHQKENHSSKSLPTIINYVSSKKNPITWGQFLFWNMTFGKAFPTIHAVWYYTLIMTRNKYEYLFYSVFVHFIPAVLIDVGLIVTGKKPRMVKTYKKIHKFLEVITFFSINEWNFQDDGVQALAKKMHPDDKILFPFQIEDLKWDEFFFNNIKTMRWCLMNDKPETLPAARRRMDRLRILHHTIKYLCIGFILSLFCWIFVKLIY